ncbi:hypothetical protein [Roseomonas elaeocarpi]|uniref:Uncharacterized protein n=1 Tax=Roseomonas elaeocarpi TaxID=907779 RepID=A0ABV6JPG0_9PROT
MSGTTLELRTTRDIVEDGVTLILFHEGDQVLAEVVGPEGYEDAVMTMPTALLLAFDRIPDPAALAVLDDEGLWQEEWGRLRSLPAAFYS